MNYARILYAFAGVLMLLVSALACIEVVLPLVGAGPRWLAAASSMSSLFPLLLLVCFFIVIALRLTRPVRTRERALAFREVRNARFYIISIVSILSICFAIVMFSLYIFNDARMVRAAMTIGPVLVGIGYVLWYRIYTRRKAAEHQAGTDAFS